MKNPIFVRRSLIAVAIAGSLALGFTPPLLAQMSSRVNFAPGNDNASVSGTVTGDEYRDYVLNARAGQTMAVSLITQGSAYFNILPPGGDGTAIYNGSISGLDATNIQLPQDGDYVIRVYLMGSDRDTSQTVPFTLSMVIM